MSAEFEAVIAAVERAAQRYRIFDARDVRDIVSRPVPDSMCLAAARVVAERGHIYITRRYGYWSTSYDGCVPAI